MDAIQKFVVAFGALMVPMSAHAYIGPGLGVGAIGAVIAFIGSVLLGVFAVLYYPIKRAIRRRRRRSANPADTVADAKREEPSQ